MTFKNHPHDLEEWLEIATRKLSNSAKQRIRTEIEAHFAEAMAAHEAEGASEVGARAMALEELGHARAANRRFRKHYLVAWEAKHLDFLLSPKRMKKTLLVQYVLFARWIICEALFMELRNDPSFRFRWNIEPFKWALELLIIVVLPTISFLLARGPSARKRKNCIILLESFGGLSTGFLIATLLPLTRFGILIFSLMGLACLINFWAGLHLMNKLRHA